jgi:hypothetical protein
MSATGVCVCVFLNIVRVERVNYCNTYKKCPQRGCVCVCVCVSVFKYCACGTRLFKY